MLYEVITAGASGAVVGTDAEGVRAGVTGVGAVAAGVDGIPVASPGVGCVAGAGGVSYNFV